MQSYKEKKLALRLLFFNAVILRASITSVLFVLFLPLSTAWGALTPSTEPNTIADLCQRVLKAKLPEARTDLTPEIVTRTTESIINNLFFESERDSDLKPLLHTSDLTDAFKRLSPMAAFVRANPQQFSFEFRQKLFNYFYTLQTELELRFIQRSLFPNVQDVENESENVALTRFNLSDLFYSLGENPRWDLYRDTLQRFNERHLLSFYDRSTDTNTADIFKAVTPFATYESVPADRETTDLIWKATENFFRQNSYSLTPEILDRFTGIRRKLERIADIIDGEESAVSQYLTDIIIGYEFLTYSQQDPEIKDMMDETLSNILASSLLRYGDETASPETAACKLKQYVFYDQPQIHTQLIALLEAAAGDHIRFGAADLFIQALAKELLIY